MHTFDEQAEAIAQANIRYALERIRMDPPPLNGPLTQQHSGNELDRPSPPKALAVSMR